MKKSLFEEKTVEELKSRINKLAASSIPVWGKMNVSQMLAHCNVAYESALGKIESKDESNFLFRTVVKWVVLSEKPFRRSLPTGKDFIIADVRQFETEKNRLLQNIADARRNNATGGWKPHPAFGSLKPLEWGWLLYKHTDHHLQQFGV